MPIPAIAILNSFLSFLLNKLYALPFSGKEASLGGAREKFPIPPHNFSYVPKVLPQPWCPHHLISFPAASPSDALQGCNTASWICNFTRLIWGFLYELRVPSFAIILASLSNAGWREMLLHEGGLSDRDNSRGSADCCAPATPNPGTAHTRRSTRTVRMDSRLQVSGL